MKRTHHVFTARAARRFGQRGGPVQARPFENDGRFAPKSLAVPQRCA